MGHPDENSNPARPSSDRTFADKIQRMIQPEALKKNEPLFWSPGLGTDLWQMFCAAIHGARRPPECGGRKLRCGRAAMRCRP